MTPEAEILEDLLAQGRASLTGLDDALSLLHTFPASMAEYAELPTTGRVASTAMLKGFEQLEDTLASLFRAILKSLGQPLKGLYALDIGNHMMALNVLDDAAVWLDIVKLRNELVHEYPLSKETRFAQLTRAHAAIPVLRDAFVRADGFVRLQKGWIGDA